MPYTYERNCSGLLSESSAPPPADGGGGGDGVFKLNDGKTTSFCICATLSKYLYLSRQDHRLHLRVILRQRRSQQEPCQPVQRVQAQVQVRRVREKLRHQQQLVQVHEHEGIEKE